MKKTFVIVFVIFILAVLFIGCAARNDDVPNLILPTPVLTPDVSSGLNNDGQGVEIHNGNGSLDGSGTDLVPGSPIPTLT